MTELDPMVKDFLVESHENLDQLDRDLLALEASPCDTARLASVFRTVHTIKGTCGFFGFARLQAVTHAGENLLALLRDGQATLGREGASALLALVDAIRGHLARIEATGKEAEDDHPDLIRTLARLSAAPSNPRPPVPPPPTVARPSAPVSGGSVSDSTGLNSSDGLGSSTVRVATAVVDHLLTLACELVLVRNRLTRHLSGREDPELHAIAGQLNTIAGQLQAGVAQARMLPIGSVWGRFQRVVRDLATQCGKRVRLDLSGGETELDRTVVEAIRDPLTHLLRNAVDHGIEPPAARVAAGKTTEGQIALRARHRNGRVEIELADDGAGINPQKVRAKAVAQGLVTADEAAAMTDAELTQLIFLPGFSTAAAVTNVSGRGVGMDVVKTNVERVRGTVELVSKPGQGTAVRVSIPLTLAIVPALVVTVGDEQYCIPQADVREVLRLPNGVETVGGAAVARYRGRLLPLADLGGLTGRPDEAAGAEPTVVVIQAGPHLFGLLVAGVTATEEIVAKPLDRLLQGSPLFAGATILGDGRVAMILNVLGVARHAAVVSDRAAPPPAAAPAPPPPAGDRLLIAQVAGRTVAIPMGMVERLDEVPAEAVETGCGREVVQRRGGVLPLVRAAALLGGPAADPTPDRLQVVVCQPGRRAAGVVVDRIVDVADQTAPFDQTACQFGVRGTGLVAGRVTDLLDVPALARAAAPEFFPEVSA